MELSQSVLDGLAVAGESSQIPDKSYKVLVTRAFDGVLDERHRNLIAKDPSFRELDQAVVKETYSSMVTLVTEATKHDLDNNSISSVLEECKYASDRIETFNKVYNTKKPLMQILLSSVGTCPPHIVDVDWRLDYYIKNNHLERVNEAVYLVTLKTEVPGCSELKDVQFSCTQEQLQDMVGKLKDACKCLEKASQM
ncbi:COMM domain-containing protein 3-like [Ruditapes philippinarum]|uniref:COMM domain-containing protein 3-like n=1 Tax=Ruditapes philippinarum TaxID=129788 RepID=UPI00295B4C9D|nr:COMM domain-containing protein 3-like [Ruditapes philippinarum]